MRDSKQATWRDVLASIMEDCGEMTLNDIYKKMDGHRKCSSNVHWKEKIRQTLQKYDNFSSSSRGVWYLAA